MPVLKLYAVHGGRQNLHHNAFNLYMIIFCHSAPKFNEGQIYNEPAPDASILSDLYIFVGLTAPREIKLAGISHMIYFQSDIEGQ